MKPDGEMTVNQDTVGYFAIKIQAFLDLKITGLESNRGNIWERKFAGGFSS